MTANLLDRIAQRAAQLSALSKDEIINLASQGVRECICAEFGDTAAAEKKAPKSAWIEAILGDEFSTFVEEN